MKLATKIKRIIKGALKSWSINWSMLAVALGGLEQHSGTLTDLIGRGNAGILLMTAGIGSMLLRARTKESLEDKGAK